MAVPVVYTVCMKCKDCIQWSVWLKRILYAPTVFFNLTVLTRSFYLHKTCFIIFFGLFVTDVLSNTKSYTIINDIARLIFHKSHIWSKSCCISKTIDLCKDGDKVSRFRDFRNNFASLHAGIHSCVIKGSPHQLPAILLALLTASCIIIQNGSLFSIAN